MKADKFYKIYYFIGIALFAVAVILYAATAFARIAAVFAAAFAVHIAFYFFKQKLMDCPNEGARSVTLSYTFLLAVEMLVSVGFFAVYGSFALHSAGGVWLARYIVNALCIIYTILRYFISATRFLRYLMTERVGLLNGGMPGIIARTYTYMPLAVFCVFGAALTIHLITQSYFGPLWLAAAFGLYALLTGLCLVCTSGESTFASSICFIVLAIMKCAVPLLLFAVFIPLGAILYDTAYATLSLTASVILYTAVCAGAITDAAAAFYAVRSAIKN